MGMNGKPNGFKRILVVDDHPVLRSGIQWVLENTRDLRVCAESGDAAGAMRAIEESHPDLAIVDIKLEGRDGIDLIKDIRTRHPEVLVLVISGLPETEFGERAIRAGARGFLHKAWDRHMIVDAIRKVLAGEVYLSAWLQCRLTDVISSNSPRNGETILDRLSDREMEIFRHLAAGEDCKRIAHELNLNEKTVRSHCDRIKAKLRVSEWWELVTLAAAWRERLRA